MVRMAMWQRALCQPDTGWGSGGDCCPHCPNGCAKWGGLGTTHKLTPPTQLSVPAQGTSRPPQSRSPLGKMQCDSVPKAPVAIPTAQRERQFRATFSPPALFYPPALPPPPQPPVPPPLPDRQIKAGTRESRGTKERTKAAGCAQPAPSRRMDRGTDGPSRVCFPLPFCPHVLTAHSALGPGDAVGLGDVPRGWMVYPGLGGALQDWITLLGPGMPRRDRMMTSGLGDVL